MQDLGSTMHRSASQFARLATEASVTGDLKGPLAALSTLTQNCVACHAAYRLY
jgi:cytochrome c556